MRPKLLGTLNIFLVKIQQMLSHLLVEACAKVNTRNESGILSSNCETTSANSGSSIIIANQLKSVRSCCFRQIAACLCTTPAFACCSWTIFRYLDTNLARAGLPVEFLSLHGAVRATDLKPSLSFEMIPVRRYSAEIIFSHPILTQSSLHVFSPKSGHCMGWR